MTCSSDHPGADRGLKGSIGCAPGNRLTWLSARPGSPSHPGLHSCRRESSVNMAGKDLPGSLQPLNHPKVGVAGSLSPFDKGRNWA